MMRPAAFFVLAAVALGACSKGPKAPTDAKVCYHMGQLPDGKWRFNKLSSDQKSIEYCAVELERMRLNFLRMGGSNREIVGSYQGQFIFLRDDGIFVSRNYDGVRYLALRRYNGKLVKPSAIVQQ